MLKKLTGFGVMVGLGLGLGLLVGCGTSVPQPSRTDVTDVMRVACGPLGYGDAQIATLLAATEADRLNGWSYQDETAYAIYVICPPAPDPGACQDCALAATRQIYGY